MTTTASPLAESEPATGSWVNRTVLQLIATQVVFGLSWSLYLLIPKYLTTVLHAGPEVVGLSSAAGGVAGVLTMPFAAFGLDRVGRVLFFRVGTAFLVLLSLGFLQVHEVNAFVYVLQGLVAASWVLAFNALAALLADVTPPQKLGQAIGWLGGANVMMNAVSTAIAEPIAASYGWPIVFKGGAVIGCIAFALSFALREAPRPSPVDARATIPSAAPAARGLGGILIASVLSGAVFSAMFSFIQPYALGAGAHEVRGFFIGFTASAVICRVGLGSLGDRLGRRPVSTWMLVGYGVCCLLTARLDPDWLMAYGFAFGAAHGLFYPTMSALVLELISPSRRGLGLVLFNGAFHCGTAISGLGWGLLAKYQGYPAVYVASTALSLIAAGVLAFSGRQRAHGR